MDGTIIPQSRDDAVILGPPLNRHGRSLSKSPSRLRSLSDSNRQLSPSPKFKEPPPKSRDDNVIIATPTKTSRRLSFSAKGLSLQMPTSDTNIFNIASPRSRGSFPPSVDARDSAGSPGNVLPRHSRGLDFSRACTNLHHSTLAESSPDSSPVITQKSMPGSRRGSVYSMMLDSPGATSGWWGNERPFQSSASNSSSDDEEMRQDDPEEAIITTPLVRKGDNYNAVTPYGASRTFSLGGWTPGAANMPSSYANFHRHRLGRGRSRKSSSSASGIASPMQASPVPTPVTEHPAACYFAPDAAMRSSISRRESISLGTNGLHITSSNDSGDENAPMAAPTTPGVVRRPVTRRSNLLPKPKGFARIRAALLEESAPVDSEAQREAEIVRQVRLNDGEDDSRRFSTSSNTTPFSPHLPPMPLLQMDAFHSASDGLGLFATNSDLSEMNEDMSQRISGNREFWSHMHHRNSTPPPPGPFRRGYSSSGVSVEDIGMDVSRASTPPQPVLSASATAQPIDIVRKTSSDSNNTQSGPSAADITRRANKRRRDEDFDPSSLKRRAVSPGMGSVAGSPITGRSPRDNQGQWPHGIGRNNQGKDDRGVAVPADEREARQTTPQATVPPAVTGTPREQKRISLMGMTDTSDGLMNMSIE